MGARGAERRSAPRLHMPVPLLLGEDETEISAVTKNLSASGAYCSLRRFLPPMTKVEVRLDISNGAPREICCRGVVVRVEPPRHIPRRTRYHVAIFFHDIATRDRLALARFVEHHLQAQSGAAA